MYNHTKLYLENVTAKIWKITCPVKIHTHSGCLYLLFELVTAAWIVCCFLSESRLTSDMGPGRGCGRGCGKVLGTCDITWQKVVILLNIKQKVWSFYHWTESFLTWVCLGWGTLRLDIDQPLELCILLHLLGCLGMNFDWDSLIK